MAPNATYREMIKAYGETRWDDTAEHAENLLTWLRHDGFPPAGMDRKKCISHCQKALSKARAMMSEPLQLPNHRTIEISTTGDNVFVPAVPTVDTPGRWWAPEPNLPAPTATKPCPFCAEPIQEAARKCKHCSEFLDPALRVVATGYQANGITQSVVVNAGNNQPERGYYIEQFDHFPHAVLTVLTLGLWLPIWFPCEITFTPRRRRL